MSITRSLGCKGLAAARSAWMVHHEHTTPLPAMNALLLASRCPFLQAKGFEFRPWRKCCHFKSPVIDRHFIAKCFISEHVGILSSDLGCSLCLQVRDHVGPSGHYDPDEWPLSDDGLEKDQDCCYSFRSSSSSSRYCLPMSYELDLPLKG